jgi:hypothetical protein
VTGKYFDSLDTVCRQSAAGSKRHSDKVKFCNDLNKPKGCELSESALRAQWKFEDFQAEYEGSIPFTLRAVQQLLT